MSNNIQDILYLLLQGKLPVAAVDSAELAPDVRAIYSSIKYLAEKGEDFPLNPKTTWRVAQERFNGTTETKELLKDLEVYEPNPTVLNAVREAITLRRASVLVTEQLATGQYNFPLLQTLFSSSADVRRHLHHVRRPKRRRDEYLMRTNFPELDAVIGGLNSELIIVAARPKTGKSTFFFNLICAQPDIPILYITVNDYDEDDVLFLLEDLDPKIYDRKSLVIGDFTSVGAELTDIEGALSQVRPKLCIVDRAETMRVGAKFKEDRNRLGFIFDTLRTYAKKYHCPVLVDAQLSANAEEKLKAGKPLSYSDMAEDRTARAAVLDLFFGMYRVGSRIGLEIIGRRKGLPTSVTLRSQRNGKYITTQE